MRNWGAVNVAMYEEVIDMRRLSVKNKSDLATERVVRLETEYLQHHIV